MSYSPPGNVAGPVRRYNFAGIDASGSFFGLRGLTAVSAAPIITPSQGDWDTTVGDGQATGAVPSLTAGTYIIMLVDPALGNTVSGDDGLSVFASTADSPFGPDLYSPGIALTPLFIAPTDSPLFVFVSFSGAHPTRTLDGTLYIQKIG